MTAQEKLLKDIIHELNMGANDHIYCLQDADDRRFIKSVRMLARRVDELLDCPQDTVMYALVARIWHSLSLRFNEQLRAPGRARLPMLFRNLDDMYRELFEEELFEVLDDMSTIELKWISQYSRNDKPLAERAAEVLDRRSGV